MLRLNAFDCDSIWHTHRVFLYSHKNKLIKNSHSFRLLQYIDRYIIYKHLRKKKKSKNLHMNIVPIL